MAKLFVELEKLVARIQRQLAPHAEVLHDQRLPGLRSGRSRQIDVLVRQKIGQYDIKIIIDCKDYKKPADVKAVEGFYGLFEDVGAHKGVLVCPAGFSAAAKTRAEGLQIDLYSPVDTEPHKWQVKPEIPALCDFRSATISFGINIPSTTKPWILPQNFFSESIVFDDCEQQLGTPFSTAVDKWNSGGFSDAVGEHPDQPVFEKMDVLIDNGYKEKIPAKIFAKLKVSRQLYFGQLPITNISGFKDEIKGGVITNAFDVIVTADEVEKDWMTIENEDQAPIHPVIEVNGRVCWAQ